MQEQQIRWLIKVRGLFFQVGIKSVTMDHIAAHLGISKKTLYQWVPNKQVLVLQLVGAFVAQDRSASDQAHQLAKNALDEFRYICAFAIHDLEMMKTNVVFDIKNFYPEAWDLMRTHQRTFITEVVAKNLQRGIDEGYYLSDLPIDLVSRLHGHQIFNLFDEEWFPSKQFAAQGVFAEFIKRYLFSITNEKGRKYLEKHWNEPLKIDFADFADFIPDSNRNI
jgi:AcrR family transcriptional regulator